jgi:hypothetical protein
MNWGYRPRHYAAIHFHEDDLYDCGWETDFEATISDAMASGVYGGTYLCHHAMAKWAGVIRRS